MLNPNILKNPNHPKGYYWTLTPNHPHPLAKLDGDNRKAGREKMRVARKGIPELINVESEAIKLCKVANARIGENWFIVVECSPL